MPIMGSSSKYKRVWFQITSWDRFSNSSFWWFRSPTVVATSGGFEIAFNDIFGENTHLPIFLTSESQLEGVLKSMIFWVIASSKYLTISTEVHRTNGFAHINSVTIARAVWLPVECHFEHLLYFVEDNLFGRSTTHKYDQLVLSCSVVAPIGLRWGTSLHPMPVLLGQCSLCTVSASGRALATSAWPASWKAVLFRSSCEWSSIFVLSPWSLCLWHFQINQVYLVFVSACRNNAASLTKFSKSAPLKPGVPLAMSPNSTSSASNVLLACTSDGFSSFDIGVTNVYTSVKSTGAQQANPIHRVCCALSE